MGGCVARHARGWILLAADLAERSELDNRQVGWTKWVDNESSWWSSRILILLASCRAAACRECFVKVLG